MTDFTVRGGKSACGGGEAPPYSGFASPGCSKDPVMAIRQFLGELALPLAAILLGIGAPALFLVALYGWW